jgi:hypothetical protein
MTFDHRKCHFSLKSKTIWKSRFLIWFWNKIHYCYGTWKYKKTTIVFEKKKDLNRQLLFLIGCNGAILQTIDEVWPQ